MVMKLRSNSEHLLVFLAQHQNSHLICSAHSYPLPNIFWRAKFSFCFYTFGVGSPDLDAPIDVWVNGLYSYILIPQTRNWKQGKKMWTSTFRWTVFCQISARTFFSALGTDIEQRNMKIKFKMRSFLLHLDTHSHDFTYGRRCVMQS